MKLSMGCIMLAHLLIEFQTTSTTNRLGMHCKEARVAPLDGLYNCTLISLF